MGRRTSLSLSGLARVAVRWKLTRQACVTHMFSNLPCGVVSHGSLQQVTRLDASQLPPDTWACQSASSVLVVTSTCHSSRFGVVMPRASLQARGNFAVRSLVGRLSLPRCRARLRFGHRSHVRWLPVLCHIVPLRSLTLSHSTGPHAIKSRLCAIADHIPASRVRARMTDIGVPPGTAILAHFF